MIIPNVWNNVKQNYFRAEPCNRFHFEYYAFRIKLFLHYTTKMEHSLSFGHVLIFDTRTWKELVSIMFWPYFIIINSVFSPNTSRRQRPASSSSGTVSSRSSGRSVGNFGSYKSPRRQTRGQTREQTHGNTPLDPVYEYRDHTGQRSSRQFSRPDPHAFDSKDDASNRRCCRKQCVLICLALISILVIVAVATYFIFYGKYLVWISP